MPVNAIVPAVDPDAVRDLVLASGCSTVKVKVAEPGQTLADDVARVGAVRDALGAEGRVRVDANGAWSVDDAVRSIAALIEFGLEYVEQPCSTIDGARFGSHARGRPDRSRRGNPACSGSPSRHRSS